MTNKTRATFLALAALVAVVVFVLARPEEGSERADDPVRQASPPTDGGRGEPTADGGRGEPTATAESALPPPPTEIVLRGGRPQGGLVRIDAVTGDTVRLVVTSDTPDEIHVHGYDIERDVGPGRSARFRFEAGLEGIFEIESHEAEDAGREPVIARLQVAPS